MGMKLDVIVKDGKHIGYFPSAVIKVDDKNSVTVGLSPLPGQDIYKIDIDDEISRSNDPAKIFDIIERKLVDRHNL